MPTYAQTAYQNKQGINGKYTIAQIGCLMTSFCDVLDAVGVHVNPPALNQWFIDHKTFIDVDDGVRDDLGWSSVTAYCPNLTVARTGAGTPTENGLVIVKFKYKSPRTGNVTTHFCVWKGDHTILDPWDNKVKKISSTSYGQPVGYAVYVYKKPQAVKPVSAYTGNVVSAAKNRFTRLPAPINLVLLKEASLWFINFTSWSTAKSLNKQPANTPFRAVGKYDHPLGGTYYLNEVDFGNADQDGTPTNWLGYNKADLATPAPAAPAAPQPAAAPAPAPATAPAVDTNLQPLQSPLELQTKADPTSVWDLTAKDWPDFKAAIILPKATPFKAVAKYTHPLGGVYFLDEEHYNAKDLKGVNTVDLEPKPAPVAPVEAAEVAAPALVSDENHIEVKVVPAAPDAWKATFKINPSGWYRAQANIKVYDIDDPSIEPLELIRGQRVRIGGDFTGPDGIKYYRTEKSTEANTWRAIPKVALAHEDIWDDLQMLLNDDFVRESREQLGKLSTKEKLIRRAAIAEANKINIFGRFKFGHKE